MGRHFRVILAAVGALLVAWLGWRSWDRWRTARELEALHDRVQALRAQADSCRVAVNQEEVLFREYDHRVDSLRRAVDDFERMRPDGVPADTYPSYLETFRRYNSSVPAWRMQVDTLRAHWEACRATAESHNVLVDSLRDRLQELDLAAPSPAAVPSRGSQGATSGDGAGA